MAARSEVDHCSPLNCRWFQCVSQCSMLMAPGASKLKAGAPKRQQRIRGPVEGDCEGSKLIEVET
jgi:hypothetical protein